MEKDLSQLDLVPLQAFLLKRLTKLELCMYFWQAMRDRILSSVPSLRLTIPFSFPVDKSLNECRANLSKLARPRTLWHWLFSYFLEIEFEPVDDTLAHLFIQKWGNRRHFFEVKAELRYSSTTSALVVGQLTGDLLYLPLLGTVAILQLLVIANYFTDAQGLFSALVVVFWSLALLTTLFFQRREAQRLIRLIQNTLNA